MGRGADCQVFLHDPRVPIIHSELRNWAGGWHIEAVKPGSGFTVNGVFKQTSTLRPGDRIEIGPFEISVLEPPEGSSLAFSVELVRPLGNDFAELVARSRTDLTRVGLGKRGWSWLLFLAMACLGLGLPLFASLDRAEQKAQTDPAEPPAETLPAMFETIRSELRAMDWLSNADTVWLSGRISNPHQYFAEDCGTCHQEAFVQVRSTACLGCHRETGHHADPKWFKTATFEDVTCARCHKEHNGAEPIVLDDQTFCISCHAGLNRREPDTQLQNVSDFGSDHPEFRPSVVIMNADSPGVIRKTLGAAQKPKESSNLKFPHNKHLDPKGTKHFLKGTLRLACADCHELEPGGLGMLPIEMERHCQSCHELTFEPSAKHRRLPHGKPREAVEQMREFYAMMALLGGFEDPNAPESVRRRRLPGDVLSEEDRLASLNWALKKAADVATETIGKRACGTCHLVTPPELDSNGIWDIAKVVLADRWMPKSAFDHARHEQTACVVCHKAETSKFAQEVLLPGIAICRGCHGGETTETKVPSGCITCHAFHRRDLPPMKRIAGN